MSRLRVALAILITLLVAPAGAAAARLAVGMGDESATMFTDPLFTSLRLQRVRFVTPWSTAIAPTPARTDADVFLAAARGRYDVLVSFATSATSGPGVAPSAAAYKRAVRAFVARYPWVRTYSPWDEANTCSEPICHRPQAAAAYYRALRGACPRCTVLAAEVLDTDWREMRGYLQRFIAAVGKPTPRLWALHPYSDANRFRTVGTRTRTMLATVPGTVWMTEVGGLYSYGRSFPPSTSRQSRAVRWMTRLATSGSRLARLYYYSFDGGGTFDAGLLSPNGSPRPAYDVFASWARSLGGGAKYPAR